MNIARYFFLLTAGIALLYAGWTAMQVHASLNAGHIVEGKVVTLEPHPLETVPGQVVTAYAPVVVYETVTGESVTVELKEMLTVNRNRYRSNPMVRIWYEAEQVENARIVHSHEIWMQPLAALIAALVSFSLAMVFSSARGRGRA